MQILTTLAQWRASADDARQNGRRVALVPTMGALHAGHESLIAAAREQCDHVIVTIFVNPRQFNDPRDLALYPRSLTADAQLCERAGADVLVEPSLAEMWPRYPEATATTVSVRDVGDGFEGADRPGHFDGVASVVAKLFSVTGPCAAFFGDKDFQQLAVIRRMVEDLALPVDVVGCPIVRDEDGLALSSRNARLDDATRPRALGLSAALRAVSDGSSRTASEVRTLLAATLATYEVVVAYADVVDPTTLRILSDADEGPGRVLLAGVVDGIRLLDNGPVTIRRSKETDRAAGH